MGSLTVTQIYKNNRKHEQILKSPNIIRKRNDIINIDSTIPRSMNVVNPLLTKKLESDHILGQKKNNQNGYF